MFETISTLFRARAAEAEEALIDRKSFYRLVEIGERTIPSFFIRDSSCLESLERATDDGQQLVRALAADAGVLRDETRNVVEVDRAAQRVQQVMANLISNAAKFSPPGSTITVSADADGNRATVRVQDQGDGIPALFRARVFEKFAQADGSDRRTSHGSGLGLPIAKDLVELMGGQIGFESEEGRGTCFWFSLPLIGEAS